MSSSTIEIATPTDTQKGESAPAGSDAYQLLRALRPGRYGTAYAAVLKSSGEEIPEQVELRRVLVSLPHDRIDELATRLRLVALIDHPTLRRVLQASLSGEAPVVVLESASDQNLKDWLTTRHPSFAEALSLLGHAASCLAKAHQIGLTHGALSWDAIGVADGVAKLDFTGFLGAADSANDVGTPEAKADDAKAFLQVIGKVLDRDAYADAQGAVSRRELARLHQLLAAVDDPSADDIDMAVLAECLHAISKPDDDEQADEEGGDRSQHVDTTSEIAIAPDESNQSDSTSEILLPDLASNDSTSQLGLVGPAPSIASLQKVRELQQGDRLGRYEIERKLGQGGMGAVFKAIDLGTQQPVAIKVLSEAAWTRGNALQRFEKEARLLASVNNPHVTNLIEVSNEDGQHYIALEFVDGIDVKRVLQREGLLGERTALSIAADVARALVDAHAREIVHRDIKPENILLVDVDDETLLDETPPQAKLTDFGIARHIDQSESLAVTQAGSVIGTPKYMSPEQCKGQGAVTPQSDVYCLGVTLFELLAGQPPFTADDPMALAGKHCFDAPPELRKLNPTVSEPVADLVKKCLAKRPEDRYADAAHLLRDADRLLRGEPSPVALRPVLPEHDESRVVSSEMTWQLAASPEALWPYVSNTDRLNRAIGLPAVTYRTEPSPTGGVRRFGTIRLAGLSMSWEEHPFEWVEGSRMSVLREFSSGPFQWFMSTVELSRLASGKTELRHRVAILPRSGIGRLIARIETGAKCRRALDKVYSRIDRTLSEQQRVTSLTQADAFEKPHRLSRTRNDLLQSRLDELKRSGADADTAERLAELIATAPDQTVAKIRPIALAEQLAIDESVVLDTFLRAVKQELFVMEWDILCPTCRVSADTQDSLKKLAAHTHCEACDYDFQSSLASAVELVLRAHPDLRDCETGKYCIGGPYHAPHVAAQLRLEPDERIEVELALAPGNYLLRGPSLTQTFGLRVQESGAPSQQLFVLQASTDSKRDYTLRAGKQLLSIENQFATQQIVRIERTIPRDDVLTAARASALPRFRELFPGEVLDSGRLVSADQVTLLTAAIASIDDLYAELGDAPAFALVEQHLADVERIVHQHRGEVVKVIGETSLASFDDARQAVRAAIALRKLHAADDSQNLFDLAVGVHRGPALVTTANNRLDYFGVTARQATALPTISGPGVTLTEAVFAETEIAQLLDDLGERGELETIQLPGKSNQLVQRFQPPAATLRTGVTT